MTSLDEWIESYRVAWETGDADAAAALFTRDSTYRSNIFEPPHQGSEGVRVYWDKVTEDQTEVKVRMGSPLVSGAKAMVEFWTTMRVSEAELTLPGCLILDFDSNGLCRALREYWQTTEGIIEPPDAWGR